MSIKSIVPKCIKDRVREIVLFHTPYFIWHKFYPTLVHIEVSNICNLHCPCCITPTISRKKGLMSISDFKKILDKLPNTIEKIEFTFAGEPLTNPKVFDMVKYANKKGIRVFISTNGTLLNRFSIKQICNPNLTLSICLDGPNKQIHEAYRVGSNFDKLCKNIERVAKAKRPTGMEVIIQSLWWKQSIKRSDETEELVKSLGVDRVEFRYFGLVGAGILNFNLLKMFFPKFKGAYKKRYDELYERFIPEERQNRQYADKNTRPLAKYCDAISSIAILWNGDVTTCCHDPEGFEVFGNLLNENFEALIKKRPTQKMKNYQLPLCQVCCKTAPEGGRNYKTVIFNK